MPPVAFRPNRLIASATRSGSASPSLFRMKNMFIRGEGEHTYAEVYAGSLDLEEDLPMEALTGTVAMTSGSNVITGTGSAFLSELHLYQRLLTSNNKVVVVRAIFSDTSFDATAPMTATASGLTARRMRVLFPLGIKRGSQLTGNALEYDRGTLLSVGSGELYVNGSLLPGDSLTASKRAKIALLEASGDFRVGQLGFSVPAGITAAPGAIPAASAFTDAEVNTGTDTINDVGHGFSTGQRVRYSTSGTLFSIDGVAVTTGQQFYIIRVDANNYKLASLLGDAVGGTARDITAAGSGTHTATPVTKVMPAGKRSLLIAKASTLAGAPMFGNPTQKIDVAALTAGQAIHVALPAMDSATDATSLHNAWHVYASEQGGTADLATANSESGPWFWVRTITDSEVAAAGGTYILEYLDAEINSGPRLVTFDNDPPVDAEYVASAAGYPVLISCNGPQATSPGPTIVPFKPHNLAAAPLILDTGQRNEVPTSPPEPIIGFYLAAGRIYLLTPNTLQIAVFVADPDFPVQTRPFWKSGFSNPYAICFVNSTLYGFTSAGAIRSATEGEPGSEEHSFAADVEELMAGWNPEDVFVVEDSMNDCVCYVHSASAINADGFFESEMLCFMQRSQTWCYFVLTSTTEDRIVSGVASVNGHLEFLAGGRLPGATFGTRTFRFDVESGESVPWHLGWQPTDLGSELRPKKIKHPRVRAKTTDATVGIHGVEPDEEFDVAVFEAGNAGSKSGAIAISDTADVTWHAPEDCAVSGLMTLAPMVEGVWDGTGTKDRVDELVLEVSVQGGRR